MFFLKNLAFILRHVPCICNILKIAVAKVSAVFFCDLPLQKRRFLPCFRFTSAAHGGIMSGMDGIPRRRKLYYCFFV